MIELLEFHNLKVIRSAKIPLEPFTVLVGPNASGKSTVLQGLQLLTQLRCGRPCEVFKGHQDPAVLRTRGTIAGPFLTLEGHWGSRRIPGRVICSIPQQAPGLASGQAELQGSLWLDWESPGLTDNYEFSELERCGPDDAPYRSFTACALWRALSPAVLLTLDADRLAEPSSADEPVTMIHPDGSGLGSVLADMAATRPDDFEALNAAVREVVPALKRLRLERANVHRTETENIIVDQKVVSRVAEREVWGYQLVVDLKGAEGIPAHAVSEGTLLTIGLFSVLMSPERPRLLLLDNLERGLHPKALGDLVKQLRAILERHPEIQIVATSHSPYLLDHVDPKEVRCGTIGPDGYARFATLSDHPDFARWKESMRPGEFWSTVGDQWVAERPEAPAKEPEAEPRAKRTVKREVKKAAKRKVKRRKQSDG